MAAKTVGESLSVLSLAGIATIRSLDGTVVQLPCAVLNRSTLLQHALSDSSEGGECYLRLPQGALEAWIHALKLAGVETGRVDQQASAKPPKGCTDEVGLIKCLQVADFLRDEDTLQKLCSKTSEQLFQPYIDSAEQAADEKLATELSALDDNLQRSVLAACKVPPLLQLSMLTEALHEPALHAAFPSIMAESSVSVTSPLYASKLSDSFWQLLGKETSLKKLRITHLVSDRMPVIEAFLSCIAQLSCLESLTLMHTDWDAQTLVSLLTALECHQSLTHLDLTGCSTDRCVGMPKLYPDLLTSQLREGFSRLTALCSLHVAHNGSSDCFLRAISPCISQFPFLHTLDMDGCYMGHEAAGELAGHLSECTGLKDLRFGKSKGSYAFSRCAFACSQLQRLDIGWYSSYDRKKPTIGEYSVVNITKLTELQTLFFQPFDLMSHVEVEALKQHISTLKSLTELSVNSHEWNRDQATDLGHIIGELPSLKKIRAHDAHDHRHDDGGKVLATALGHVPTLQHIELSTNLRPEGAAALAGVLPRLTDLQSLALIGNLGAAASKALAAQFTSLPFLTLLNLASNKLEDEGILHISDTIGKLSALRELCLAGNEITAVGWKGLGPKFSSLTVLTELNLSRIETDHAAALVLGSHLQSLTAMQMIYLDFMCLRDQGVAALAPALGKLCDLRHVGLSDNRLSCDAVDILCCEMQHVSALTRLDLCSNRVRDRGAELLFQFIRTQRSLQLLKFTGRGSFMSSSLTSEAVPMCHYKPASP